MSLQKCTYYTLFLGAVFVSVVYLLFTNTKTAPKNSQHYKKCRFCHHTFFKLQQWTYWQNYVHFYQTNNNKNMVWITIINDTMQKSDKSTLGNKFGTWDTKSRLSMAPGTPVFITTVIIIPIIHITEKVRNYPGK